MLVHWVAWRRIGVRLAEPAMHFLAVELNAERQGLIVNGRVADFRW